MDIRADTKGQKDGVWLGGTNVARSPVCQRLSAVTAGEVGADCHGTPIKEAFVSIENNVLTR